MNRLVPLEKDYYLDDEDVNGGGGGGDRSDYDDDDGSGSSEDEVQRVFADIAGVQLPSQRKRQMKQEHSFEAEMENELDASFRQHSSEWRADDSASTKHSIGETSGLSKNKMSRDKATSSTSATKKTRAENDVDPALGLNDQGTESDEEFQISEGLKGTGDDDDKLLYDPEEDDANQDWVDTHRRSYQPTASQHRPLPKSDAVLNCPACMTVLCLDCQRHEVYKTQYRAMFVMNCEVKQSELLYQPKSKKRGGAKKRKDDVLSTLKSGERLNAIDYDEAALEDIKRNSRPEDLFYPVVCCVCKTEVAVYDSDEIYHFFNTLASYA